MPRRIRQSRSLMAELLELVSRRLGRRDKELRDKALRYAFCMLGLVFFYSLVVGTYSLPHIARLELRQRALEKTNRQLTVKLVDAARTKRLLLENSTYIENIARTKYHMARPQETIYRFRRQ